jgi:RimJ/RimL family protein N-acetyltransferase
MNFTYQHEHGSDLYLRQASILDIKCLFDWVNLPSSIKNKEKTSKLISWPIHKQWFENKLINPNARIWIVECKKEAIGQVRVELIEGVLNIDIFIDHVARGKGAGLRSIELLIKKCRKLWLNIDLIATIKKQNEASIRLFKRAGFIEIDRNNKIIKFIYLNTKIQ